MRAQLNLPMAATTTSWTRWLGVRCSILVAAFAIIMTHPSFREFSINFVTSFHKSAAAASSSSSTTIVYTITPDSTGLLVDADIFGNFLGSRKAMLQEPPPSDSIESKDCVYIFLEVTPSTPNAAVHEDWGPTLRRTHCRVMAMVNTDQFTTALLDTPGLELVICKTQQCKGWLQQHQASRAVKVPILYSGFTSMEPSTSAVSNDDDLDRFSRLLHVAGSSPHKGTTNILQAWLQNPHWPPITITSHNNQLMDIILKQIKQQLGISKLPSNIHHIDTKLSRDEISKLMATHGIHLCLSGMEGFGHYMNEARAVGALCVTTDYPPMNEMITTDTGVLVKPGNMLEWTNKLPFANVAAHQITAMMNNVLLPMTLQQRAVKGKRARLAFEDDRRTFQQRMEQFACYLRDCKPGTDYASLGGCTKHCGLFLE